MLDHAAVKLFGHYWCISQKDDSGERGYEIFAEEFGGGDLWDS